MGARRALGLTGLAGAVTLTALVAAPAQGASCLTYTVSGNHRAVAVRNTCSESRRVKVVWNNATDSGCTQLRAYTGELIDSRAWPASFDRLASC